ncbi:MAG: FkbM family methyltransferase [Phycisphaeraceae bacterium]|nr:FkbM family methyltransferase [Phycisphaeraceae bacterium]
MSIRSVGQAWRQKLSTAWRGEGVVHTRALPAGTLGISRTLQRMTVRLAGQTLDVTVRQGTTDIDLIPMLLRRDGEYALPTEVQPRVIFDIGANIGMAALFFAATYPQARIHCFEPLPENIALLKENTQPFADRIRVHEHGLSNVDGTFEYQMSNNPNSYGGGTFCGIGCSADRKLNLPIRSVAHVIAETGTSPIDVFKIDTEGSEFPILSGIPEHLRRQAQAYVGELHGLHDWEVCQLLTDSHQVGVRKRYDRGCFPFIAVRRDLCQRQRRAA